MGGMGVRSKPMDDFTFHAQLVHGRPSATHATPAASVGRRPWWRLRWQLQPLPGDLILDASKVR